MVNVTITKAGEALKEKAVEIPLKLGKCMPLTREEGGTLYTLLYKILRQLNCEDKN